jgi:hypothetical protein
MTKEFFFNSIWKHFGFPKMGGGVELYLLWFFICSTSTSCVACTATLVVPGVLVTSNTQYSSSILQYYSTVLLLLARVGLTHSNSPEVSANPINGISLLLVPVVQVLLLERRHDYMECVFPTLRPVKKQRKNSVIIFELSNKKSFYTFSTRTKFPD